MQNSNLMLGKCVEKRDAKQEFFSQEEESPGQDTEADVRYYNQ